MRYQIGDTFKEKEGVPVDDEAYLVVTDRISRLEETADGEAKVSKYVIVRIGDDRLIKRPKERNVGILEGWVGPVLVEVKPVNMPPKAQEIRDNFL